MSRAIDDRYAGGPLGWAAYRPNPIGPNPRPPFPIPGWPAPPIDPTGGPPPGPEKLPCWACADRVDKSVCAWTDDRGREHQGNWRKTGTPVLTAQGYVQQVCCVAPDGRGQGCCAECKIPRPALGGGLAPVPPGRGGFGF